MSVVDVIVFLAFIVVAVVGAEAVRLACRRQLTAVPVDHAASPAEPAVVAARTTVD